MIPLRLRNALSAFSMVAIFGGPIFCVFALGIGFVEDSSGQAFGRGLTNIAPIFFGSVLNGGFLRVLISIDARLEQRV